MSKNVATAKQRTVSVSGRGKKIVAATESDDVANRVESLVAVKPAVKGRGKKVAAKVAESVASCDNLEMENGNEPTKRKARKIAVATNDNAKSKEKKVEATENTDIAADVPPIKENKRPVRKRGAIAVIEEKEPNTEVQIPSVKRRTPRAKKVEESEAAKEEEADKMAETKTEIKKLGRGRKKVIDVAVEENPASSALEKANDNKNIDKIAKTTKPTRGKKKADVAEPDANMQVDEQIPEQLPEAEDQESRDSKENALNSINENTVNVLNKTSAAAKINKKVSEELVAQNGKASRGRRAAKNYADESMAAEKTMLNEKDDNDKGINGKTSRAVKKVKNLKENINTEVDETATETLQPLKKTRKRNVNTMKAADEADGAKVAKLFKNETQTLYEKDSFAMEKPHTFKISSWNVAGLRSWIKKDGFKFLDIEEPDIFCLQETKCSLEQLSDHAADCSGYHRYWLCMPGGYAGVAIYTRIMPINVEYGVGDEEFDKHGRMITAEFEKFILVNVYVPNSGRKLVNLEERMRWEKLFLEHVQRLDKLKPVIICGDMNVSHKEIDLANPKANVRNAGFTLEEREQMNKLLAAGFVDSFRHLYPKRTGAYTFWTYMGAARKRNVGWRLDYFLISERFLSRVVDNVIRSQCMGSDHCPITLFLQI